MGEGRRCHDMERILLASPDGFDRLLDLAQSVEKPAALCIEALRFPGGMKPTGVVPEQDKPKFVFENLKVAADSGLRQSHAPGRGADAGSLENGAEDLKSMQIHAVHVSFRCAQLLVICGFRDLTRGSLMRVCGA